MYKFDKSEVLANGTIQLRGSEILVLQDGTEYETGKYHRRVFTPDMDIESIDCNTCKAMAQTLWTTEVVQAYKDSIANIGGN